MFGRKRSGYITETPDAIPKLQAALEEADAVVIGAGAGLSTSAGFTYTGERFETYFQDFYKKYHFMDMYSGGFYPYETLEENWAYWSRYIYINRYCKPPKPVYENLLRLVEEKNYYVLTTNVDHQFQKAGFDKRRIFYTQGDYGLWQCSKPCHNRVYENKSKVIRMVLAQGFSIDEQGTLTPPLDEEGQVVPGALKMRIPSEMVPYCPVCCEPMSMNLRADETFVEDDGWHKASSRYSAFLAENVEKNILFLELGVGANTPVIIKYPFWKMTAESQSATYACINQGEAIAPEDIRKKAICINDDIGTVIEKLIGE